MSDAQHDGFEPAFPAAQTGPAPASAAAAGAGRRRTRRVVIWLGAFLAVLLTSTVAFAGYKIYRIDHNFTKAPLHAAASPVQGVVKAVPDAFGNTPLNILVIGTDVRLPGKDAELGGFVDTSARADVEMLVHVSADRSNATVVSIPRDTMVPIPDCTDQAGGRVPGRSIDLVNSALAGGPGCQVDTLEALTHVQIDHFIMVDFSGVVDLTDAVGGVDVCVTKAVNDPDSHLSVPAGTSKVAGQQALAFLRTREGFANGSDLYRTQAQHQYLSSLIRKLKDQATLDDPLKALSLAEVASKALTMDPDIAGVTKLLDLASTMKKVPTSRITFMTMPTVGYRPDPNRVTVDPVLDEQIFTLIAHDQSVTAPTETADTLSPAPGGSSAAPAPAPSGTPTSSPAATVTTVDTSAVREQIVVENGSSVNGRSKDVASILSADGFKNTTGVGYTSDSVKTTEIFYAAGHQAAAEAVAQALHLPSTALRPGSDGNGQVVLRVGTDFASGSIYEGSTPTASSVPADGPTALPSSVASQAAVENASDTGLCVNAAG